MTALPYGASAHGHARMQAATSKRVRPFVTPEGVDLRLEIASAALRLLALVLDIAFILGIMLALALVLAFTSLASWDVSAILAMLAWFVISNFWFALFELGPRAATPGKRIAGIRVVARDGGPLTVSAVIARNIVRQVEMLLPLAFIMGGGDDLVSESTRLLGMLWTLGFGFFLLFNRDRMRLGDLIGGTWVVVAKRRRMVMDIAAAPLADGADAPVFSEAELAVYGVFELQELERVLRLGERNSMTAVADAIRTKLGRTLQETDEVFLASYYRQLKARQERNLLFGKRRANKYEDPV